MIPLRDDAPREGVPWVTWALLLLNGAIFAYQLSLGSAASTLIERLGLSPMVMLSSDGWADGRAPAALLGHLFLHAGWLHLLGNLWVLHVFAPALEGRMGALRFGRLYLGCGVAAALAQVAVNPASAVPMIGASGALAGVLGAYLVLFPGSRVQTLMPLPLILVIEVPAFVFLGIWALLQVLNATANLGAEGGVAWFAHLGGFGAGVGYALLRRGDLRRPRPARHRR